MSKEITVTERCEQIKNEMLAKLEEQEQAFVQAYYKTYGELPEYYVNKLKENEN